MKKVLKVLGIILLCFILFSIYAVYKTNKELEAWNRAEEWYIEKRDALVKNELINLLKQNGKGEYNNAKIELVMNSDDGLYYICTFQGKYNGRPTIGDAFAFSKYKSNKVEWFGFDLGYTYEASNPINKWYKNEYDSIVKEYYNELWDELVIKKVQN